MIRRPTDADSDAPDLRRSQRELQSPPSINTSTDSSGFEVGGQGGRMKPSGARAVATALAYGPDGDADYLPLPSVAGPVVR